MLFILLETTIFVWKTIEPTSVNVTFTRFLGRNVISNFLHHHIINYSAFFPTVVFSTHCCLFNPESMNLSVWSKSMYSTSNICLDGCTGGHLSSFQPDPVLSNLEASGVSIQKDTNMKITPESDYYSSSEAGSGLIFPSRPDLDPPRDGTSRRHPSPASSSCGHNDWNLNSGHQAKRARVENIIKGMTSSPGAHCSDVMTNQNEGTDCMQGNERIHQEHTERTGPGGTGHSQTTIEQLESQQQHFRQLRAKFNYVDEASEATDSSAKEKYPTCAESPDTSPGDAFTDSYSEFESSSSRKYQGWKKVKLMNYFQTKPERIKLMADVLKYELSRAVSRSVDSVFKSMPLLQASLNNEGSTDTDIPLQSIVCDDKKLRLSCCGKAEVPDVQTEALSLVVQKPRLDKLLLQPRSRSHHRPKAQVPFSHDLALHEDNQPTQENQSALHQHGLRCLQDRCSDVGQAKFEMFDTRWNSVKVRSKVNSRSVRSPQTHTVSVDPMLLESLCLPHVKVESDSLVKSNLYMLNVSFLNIVTVFLYFL